MKFLRFSKHFCLFLSSLILISCQSKTSGSATKTFEAMNTFMSIRSYGANAEKGNIAAEEEIRRIEKQLSVTDSESEIYKINNAEGETTEISRNVASLLSEVLDFAASTDNAFNPMLYPVTKSWGFTTGNYRVPAKEEISQLMLNCQWKWLEDAINPAFPESDLDSSIIRLAPGKAFDLGAVGKGYAGDRAIEFLKKNGITSAVLDLGGNVQLLGKKPDGSEYKIGLKSPKGGEVPLSLTVSDCAVITSGGYERFFTADDGNSYIHIFDGRTGYPVKNNLLSVTIITESGFYGDLYSTTGFILGKEWLIKYRRKTQNSFDFIILFDDDSISYSEGLTGKINLLQKFTSVEVIR